MKKYRVTISTDTDDGSAPIEFYFECMADNKSHAKEQAVNAYPEDDVLLVEVMS